MKFIVFEGLDGAGKSTLIDSLSKTLVEQNRPVVVSREPGGTILGDQIRDLLLKRSEHAPRPWAELLLYAAARSQHVECLIRPALVEKKWVLCDRYSASSVAFQCGGRGLPRTDVDRLNQIATQNLQPDLYVLLDLPTDVAFARMKGRELDRFEIEKKDFHEKVRQSYLEQAHEDPDRWLVLDARLEQSQLQFDLLNALKSRKWLHA
jgi:dTMP kinase